jgi:hypothetical protein
VSEQGETFGTVYDIIHANGTPQRIYSAEGLPPTVPEFARKVRIDSVGTAINSNVLNDPEIFGRLKLWD